MSVMYQRCFTVILLHSRLRVFATSDYQIKRRILSGV
jgi:hypothetical protein